MKVAKRRTALTMTSHRIKCRGCELDQIPAAKCRRCEKPFPARAILAGAKAATDEVIRFGSTLPTMAELETLLIAEALRRTCGDRAAAAALIGIGRTTMFRKLKAA